MANIKNIILLYKKSTYKHYFLSNPFVNKSMMRNREVAERFLSTHKEHYKTLHDVEKFLKSEKLPFKKVLRGHLRSLSPEDLLITVGGDGTFLEGSVVVKNQMILGVNSDPKWSVGRFCYANLKNFRDIVRNTLSGQCKIKELNRMEVRFAKSKRTVLAINDILICHRNPAAMSRYFLTFQNKTEEQRSSGIWVATAAGSTGAIRSAGGKVLLEDSNDLEFLVRELYCGKTGNPQHHSAIFSPRELFKVTSLMRDGLVFIDGSHVKYPFLFSEELTIQSAGRPLRVIVG